MKRFIIQIIVLAAAVVMSFLWVLSQADGYTDPFYLRFTTQTQDNLILGNSRAAQGIQPQVFSEELELDIFNYSFTVGQSPYGPTYLRSIKKKLNKNIRDGIFIITVDPWCISSTTLNPNDTANFQEKLLLLGKLDEVNKDPNYSYLLKNLGGGYHKALRSYFPGKPKMVLHKDGWLEVDITMDPKSVENRTIRKMEEYNSKISEKYSYSSARVDFLVKTIEFLRPHGQVFLVRLPIHSRMMEIENTYMPDLSVKLSPAIEISDGFLDLTTRNEQFQYTDGSHLYKDSGKEVSEIVAQWIIEIQPSH